MSFNSSINLFASIIFSASTGFPVSNFFFSNKFSFRF